MTTATDTFTAADSTTGLNGRTTETGALTWSALTGTWGIRSNQAYTASGLTNSIVSLNLGAVDHTIEATIPIRSAGGSPTLVCRIADSVNWIGYQAQTGAMFRCLAGSYTSNAATLGLVYLGGNTISNMSSTTSDVLKLVASGRTVTFYKNGTAICRVNDSTSGTGVGLRSDNTTPRYDNITATTGSGSASILTNSVAPAVTGTATTGSMLTVSTGTWSATPDSFTYRWSRGGVAVPGATASTYAIVTADGGATLTATVTAVKAGYTSGTATSNGITATATTFANSSLPVISGVTSVGQTLSTTDGTWSMAPDSYSYQWKRAGSILPGATSSSYTLLAADTSNTVTVVVTAVKAGYAAVSAGSAATSAITATASTGVISPNDANIVYSPYNWNVTSTLAQTVNSAAYLRTTVAGSATSIIANFDTAGSSGTVSLWVKVDDAVPYAATYGLAVTITIPPNIWSKHIVEILVSRINGSNRWSAPPTASVKFTGFTVLPRSVVTTTTRRRPYNVLCYGDSIGEGYSTVANGVTDARFGWAYPLRDLLGAEVGSACFNASGLLTGGESNTVPLPSSYNYLWAGQPRSFTSPAEPDLVVINLGTNDSADVTSAATSVLNGLMAATTTATIAVVQQYKNTNHKTQWTAAIAASTTPSRATYVDTTGWLSPADTSDSTHPFGYVNVSDLCPRVAATLAALLGGTPRSLPSKRFINVRGTAVPLS